jgi:GTP-binding protein
MKIKTVAFVKSSSKIDQCPKNKVYEYAFIGRSNVGKSSLINALTNRKALAKISVKPGKTQLINHYRVNEDWYLVDLPGYGYAKVSKSKRSKFSELITSYVMNRENLINLFVLADSRIEPQDIDIEFMEWLGEMGIAFSVVLTKTDKLSVNKIQSQLAKFKRAIQNYFSELPPIFISSAANRQGVEEILNYIEEINNELNSH